MKSSFLYLSGFAVVILSALANAQDAPRTLVLLPDFVLPPEQRAALQSQVESARTRCHSTSGNLVVALDLVVPEVFPTTGISPTEVVAVFLTGKGITYLDIKQGQVARPLVPSEVMGRTVQLAFSCQS